ncbi:MAG: hypothetical protein Q8933_19890 [Bacteroidota bacterium]|nr:hypothetical protein [Bacteroidota bacterium]
MIKLLTATLLFFSASFFAQETSQDSIWQNFKFLSGNWEGKGGGEPGQGIYERSYNFIFNNRFIEVRNKSTYPPSNENLKGEVHQDIGYISYDKIRKTFVLRQFHVEGFVNQYILESMSTDGKKIVFISEAIENIKPGWRAKETYQVNSDNEFTETFELAPPNKEFEAYSTVTLKKKK